VGIELCGNACDLLAGQGRAHVRRTVAVGQRRHCGVANAPLPGTRRIKLAEGGVVVEEVTALCALQVDLQYDCMQPSHAEVIHGSGYRGINVCLKRARRAIERRLGFDQVLDITGMVEASERSANRPLGAEFRVRVDQPEASRDSSA
jgi:hypothetical protein